MIKPKGYDEAAVYTGARSLPKGGYVCEVKKIEEGKSQAGNDVLRVFLDIAEGEYKGLFMERYHATPESPNKKWKCIDTVLVLDTTTGGTNQKLKGFLTSVEESNAGFVVDKCWGDDFCKFFKGKLVGCVFGDEYFKGTDGQLHSFAKPRFYISIDKIKKGEFKIPKDKYPPEEISFDVGGEMFTETKDDDCPF